MEQLLEKLSGFKNIRTIRLSPYGYSIYKKNFNELSPLKNQLQSIEGIYHEWSKKYSLDIRFSSYEDADSYIPENRAKIFNRRAICTGNVWGVVILPNGDVTICEELYDHPAFILGNITRNSLKEIWNSQKAIELYENPLKKYQFESLQELQFIPRMSHRCGSMLENRHNGLRRRQLALS